MHDRRLVFKQSNSIQTVSYLEKNFVDVHRAEREREREPKTKANRPSSNLLTSQIHAIIYDIILIPYYFFRFTIFKMIDKIDRHPLRLKRKSFELKQKRNLRNDTFVKFVLITGKKCVRVLYSYNKAAFRHNYS